jgi:hypothetical protein
LRFALAAEVLDADEPSLALLDRLVDRIATEIHDLELREAHLLQESAWYRGARATRQKLVLAALATPPTKESTGKRLEITDHEALAVAERLAYSALHVLVEDRESDGELLETLVEELGDPDFRAKWKRASTVTPPGVEIENAGGGGQIPDRVTRHCEDALAAGRPLRLFVIRDRDARWPDDTRNERDLATLRKICENCGAYLHVLRKRSAENYIPDAVFAACRELPQNERKRPIFEAFLRRSRIQRDYFPVKSGLTPSELKDGMVHGLYDESERADLELLCNRLFPKRPRPLKLLRKEQRPAFTADGLRERDGDGELDELVDALSREL